MFEIIEQFIKDNEDEIIMCLVFLFVIIGVTAAQIYVSWFQL